MFALLLRNKKQHLKSNFFDTHHLKERSGDAVQDSCDNAVSKGSKRADARFIKRGELDAKARCIIHVTRTSSLDS